MISRCFTLALVACTPATTPETIPIRVSVRGNDDVHVLIAAAAHVPCDARDNIVLFDGILRGGTTRRLTTSYPSLCERHTWGPLRDERWSADWLWKLTPGASGIDVDVSAGHP